MVREDDLFLFLDSVVADGETKFAGEAAERFEPFHAGWAKIENDIFARRVQSREHRTQIIGGGNGAILRGIGRVIIETPNLDFVAADDESDRFVGFASVIGGNDVKGVGLATQNVARGGELILQACDGSLKICGGLAFEGRVLFLRFDGGGVSFRLAKLFGRLIGFAFENGKFGFECGPIGKGSETERLLLDGAVLLFGFSDALFELAELGLKRLFFGSGGFAGIEREAEHQCDENEDAHDTGDDVLEEQEIDSGFADLAEIVHEAVGE